MDGINIGQWLRLSVDGIRPVVEAGSVDGTGFVGVGGAGWCKWLWGGGGGSAWGVVSAWNRVSVWKRSGMGWGRWVGGVGDGVSG